MHNLNHFESQGFDLIPPVNFKFGGHIAGLFSLFGPTQACLILSLSLSSCLFQLQLETVHIFLYLRNFFLDAHPLLAVINCFC